MSGSLGVGVVGLGVGQAHAEALRRIPGVRVVHLCDTAADKRAWARRRFPKAAVGSRADAVWGDPAVQAVVISTYDDAHAGQVLAALARGKHVFVEKPLCRTAAELAAIHRAWRRHRGRVALFSNLVLRAAPLYEWLRARIRAGAFGRVYAFDGDYLYGRLWKITDGWRGRAKDYSVMEGGGIHLIDLLLWTTGERPRSVWATGNRIATAGTAFRYKDFAAATLTFPSGMVARITANFGCVHPHQHVVRVFGTRRTFLYDDAGPREQVHRDPGPPARPVPRAPLPSHKGALLGGFVRALRRGTDTAEQTRLFFDGLSVALAADRSLRTGKPEEVHYL
ncbi:MAG: Gfo/Idh/MocA family oxidoreductase [Elusimicrobia bacterium]|nr:Gfo/Idh/MocA family oxidoreductase [Elusimicrobiota bacterium]